MQQLTNLRRVTKAEDDLLESFRLCDDLGQEAVQAFLQAALELSRDRSPIRDNVVSIFSAKLAS